MGRECQVNWKNSQSDSKAVPPKVMFGDPKGNTGFKHCITPEAAIYSPSARAKAGGLPHRFSLLHEHLKQQQLSPFPQLLHTTNQCPEAQPQDCRS